MAYGTFLGPTFPQKQKKVDCVIETKCVYKTKS